MARGLRTASLWAPPLMLMAVIFVLSGLPDDGADRGFAYFLARKVAHFAEYALLLALWWRALRTRLSDRSALVAAFAITVGYAITDEFHQTFVEGRVGTPRDVAIDSFGAATAAALLLRYGDRAGRRSYGALRASRGR